jgi:hypothetical protein
MSLSECYPLIPLLAPLSAPSLQLPILFLTLGFLETKRYIGFKETGSVSGGGRDSTHGDPHCILA